MAPGRVVVVGLGPAGADHVLPIARSQLERAPLVLARTARHPAVAELARDGIQFEALDHCYETAATIDNAYRAVVDAVVAAAMQHEWVAYAVPGSPTTAERTSRMLAAVAGIDIEVVPGLSFAELAWSRLGVDPLDGDPRLVDAHDPASFAGASGPMLIAQCDSRLVLSEVKLALGEALPPETELRVLRRLGLEDESITSVALEDLDRTVDPDHLTSVFVDTGDRSVAGELAALYALVERLRGPGGCPWDAEQTHHSLARHTIEEAYEVVEAIGRLPVDAPATEVAISEDDYDALADELGDLLFQVFIHAALAREAAAFTIGDVAAGTHEKLVRRHPHVFGSVRADTSEAVVANWEQIKRSERGSTSLVDGITPGLPALVYAAKVLRKTAAIGLEPEAVVGAPAQAVALIDAIGTATPEAAERLVAESLAAIALAARTRGLDGETALRAWTASIVERFGFVERAAAAAGVDVVAAPPGEVGRWWEASNTRSV